MKIHILGSGAGGFPRWNCNCGNCNGRDRGAKGKQSRTGTSIAVSSNELDWVLFNASPDILTQIGATPALHPGPERCDSGIAAIMLMDAEVDSVTGLLMLREGIEIPLYCTPSVWCALTDSVPLVHAMSHYHAHWYPLAPQLPEESLSDVPSLQLPKIERLLFTPVALHSDVPALAPKAEFRDPGDRIGMLIQDQESGKTLFYAPTLGKMEPHVEHAMRMADCILIDGTVWSSSESSCAVMQDRRGREMGHLPLFGAGGVIETLDALGSRRKILIHIGNANPVLDEGSEERARLAMHGIEVAYDGMEIVL